MSTVRDLAQELGVDVDDVRVYADQITWLDGKAATWADYDGDELTDAAADVIREQVADSAEVAE